MEAAPVIVDNSPFRRTVRRDRQLQQAATQSVTFQGTVFANNAQRDPPALFSYGVIRVTGAFNNLAIVDCEFTDNIYDQDFGVSSTKQLLIFLFYSRLTASIHSTAWNLCYSKFWRPRGSDWLNLLWQ